MSNFIGRALSLTQSGRFVTEFDPEWRSACEIEQRGNEIHWKPCLQQDPVNFAGLANAVEQPIHSDIQSYYGLYWSGGLQARSTEGPVNLIQLWNPDDFDRLIENLVGHLFAKKQAGLPFTVFFATTDVDSELFLSIDNESGRVLLEEPGQPPLREVETDIASFLDRLEAQQLIPGLD